MESRIQDIPEVVFSVTHDGNSPNMAIRNRDQCQRVTRHASGFANQADEVKVVEIPFSKRKCKKVVSKKSSKKSYLPNKDIYIQEDVCLMVIPIYAKVLWSRKLIC